MGALKGSIAVRRYAVLDPLPADPRRRIVKGLRAHCFMPLDPKSDVDRAVGWVSIFDPDDADIEAGKVFFVAPGGEQLRVGLRTDVLKAPAGEVRRRLAARAAEMEANEGRSIGRGELKALKEEVERELRLRAFPRVKVVDVVWDLDGKRIYVWAQSKAATEQFVDLFTKSTGLKLDVEGPARWASGLVEPRRIAALEPTRELWMGFSGVRPLSTGGAGESEEG